ncbi:uncharacterized protein TNCV_2046271 [Trichonephila clavipes]|uniref:Uncharacterized protein n=1 Tax=Trichonephila clavipes TaxID=2585209 RepID=A0A8X6SRI0_TRICX|nr:uncharacterized protein TNCV_2046271 [Trichonephila clavipes]
MPNSPSQMIPDRHDWRQIWGSGDKSKGSNSEEKITVATLPFPCEMSWMYLWTVMVSRINARGDRVLLVMAPHTNTPAVGVVCRCKAQAGLRRSPRSLHTRTRLSSLLRLNLDSSLKSTWFHSSTVQFPCARHHSKRRHRWVGVKGSTRNGHRDPKCPSARRLRMLREDTGGPDAGATYAWKAADEVVGCTWAFLTMGRSSRRLVCRGRPEPGLRVNDIPWIHCSQHLLTTQSERPD